MAKPERISEQKLVDEFMGRFNTYEWPTISETSMPFTFTSGEDQLPMVIKNLSLKKRGLSKPGFKE